MYICKHLHQRERIQQKDMDFFVNQQIRRIRAFIKIVISVIFVGYVMIWIMMPTNEFWLHWLPQIHARTDSKYLGLQGANILIYTFPILLIAVLGCLYHHLEKYIDDADNGNEIFASWKQPLLVRSPLGILTWTELSFVLMFGALLVWSFSAYVHGMFKNITTRSASRMGEFVWEVRLDSVALLLGLVGNVCLSFLFFPVARGSPILRLVGLTSESSIKYHIWLSHTVLILFLSHGLCFVVFWAKTDQISQMMKWNRLGISNVAGEVALLSGLVMWITSSSPVRRKLFELFLYTHHLYIAFVFFYVLHVGFAYSCIILPGFYLFLVDRFLRFLQSQQKICVVSARVLPCQAMELTFAKDPRLKYNPASIMFINVKSISTLQWHPFTVTSNSNTDPDHISIVIKSEGSWSRKVYMMLSSSTPIVRRLQVSVEGPYSHPSSSFLRHEMLVLVSGGSGITPFISIIREIIFLSNTHEKKIPKVLLVAAFKKCEDVSMLNLLLPSSGTPLDVSRLELEIQAYVTRDTSPPTDDSPKLETNICFEPSVSDIPVTGVLGSNNWLWLGAIISVSFIIFLLLIAILDRFFIHPNGQSTNVTYSSAASSSLSAMFLCVAVVIVATIAFVTNKKRNATDCSQIRSDNMPIEKELESIPEDSFKQITTVHYGERPNLKKILSECHESKIGVFVSGPKKMRRDVAAICSSDGLHYQSFSFNW